MGEAKRRKDGLYTPKRPEYMDSDLYVTIMGYSRNFSNNQIQYNLKKFFTGNYHVAAVTIPNSEDAEIDFYSIHPQKSKSFSTLKNKMGIEVWNQIEKVFAYQDYVSRICTLRYYDGNFNLLYRVDGWDIEGVADREFLKGEGW